MGVVNFGASMNELCKNNLPNLVSVNIVLL